MDTIKNLHELARDVAPLIGYYYSPVRNLDRDSQLKSWAHIEKQDESGKVVGKLSFGLVGYGHMKGRINISVEWPHHPTNYKSYTLYTSERKDRKAEISVSGEKSAEQVAKDIKNRLLADAESLYHDACQQRDADLSYTAKKHDAIRKVAALVGKHVKDEDIEKDQHAVFYVGKSLNRVAVQSADYIKVEITANVDNIAKIIELVKSLDEDKKQAV